MNRIASDEPDEVGIISQPIVFWHRGKAHQAAVSSSAIKPDQLGARLSGGFTGDLGRSWLADPCTQALNEGLQGRAMTRSEDRKRDREIEKRLKGG